MYCKYLLLVPRNRLYENDNRVMMSARCARCGYQLSCLVGKPTICICENKDADQLRGNREADQRLCFRYTDSTHKSSSSSLIRNFKLLACSCACTARFVSDLVGNHIVCFPTRRLNSLWLCRREVINRNLPSKKYPASITINSTTMIQ